MDGFWIANITQKKLMEELGEETHFWLKEMWPPQSLDLNPLDYFIWGVLQERVQGTPHPNMESLNAHIAEARGTLDETFIISACRPFRSRMESVISANSCYIELYSGESP